MKTKSPARKTQASRPRRPPFFTRSGSSGARPFFQAKLRIGAPGDRFEREADRVADQVVSHGTVPPIQRMCTECAEEGRREGELRRQPEEEEEEPVQARAAPELQSQPIEEEEEPLQTRAGELRRQPIEEEEEEPLQAKREHDRTTGPELRTRLRSTAGGGSPLPSPVLGQMNAAFGRDFAAVRVHTGSPAVQLSEDLGAQAFTRGRDVYFNSGEFAPESHGGKHLLAHELTHVVQQGFAGPAAATATAAPKVQQRSGDGRIQRRVRPRRVSCRNPAPAIRAITGADPVGTITAADRRAIELLDDAIEELEGTRTTIRGGAPADWPTISDAVAVSLRQRFRLNPASRTVWTRTGSGTVRLLIRRFQLARRLLAGGWLRYICLGPRACCRDADDFACTRAGVSRIELCQSWWDSLTADERAITLIHEALHIYFPFIGDSGRTWGNAYCYEQFICDINGLGACEDECP